MAKYLAPQYFVSLSKIAPEPLLEQFMVADRLLSSQSAMSHDLTIDEIMMSETLDDRGQVLEVLDTYEKAIRGVLAIQGIRLNKHVTFQNMLEIYGMVASMDEMDAITMIEFFGDVVTDPSSPFEIQFAALVSSFNERDPGYYDADIESITERTMRIIGRRIRGEEIEDIDISDAAILSRFKAAVATSTGRDSAIADLVRTMGRVGFNHSDVSDVVHEIIDAIPTTDMKARAFNISKELKLLLLASSTPDDKLRTTFSEIIEQYVEDPMEVVRVSYADTGELF